MIQLTFLNGKTAGSHHRARRLPFKIGRSSESDLRLEEEGVWDQHLEIDIRPHAGFLLKVHEPALATVNGEPVHETLLRSGDVIQIGALQLQFLLSPTTQRGLRWREWLTWGAFIALTLGQIALIYYMVS